MRKSMHLAVMAAVVLILVSPLAGVWAQEKTEPATEAPAAATGTPLTPEAMKKFQQDFLGNMDALLNRYEAPPEVSNLFKGFAGLMQEAQRGGNPVESFRGKSPAFFKDMESMVGGKDLPPEAANMMKSFMSLMQEALKAQPAAPTPAQ